MPEDAEHPHGEWPWISLKAIDGVVKRPGHSVRQAADHVFVVEREAGGNDPEDRAPLQA